MTEQIERAAIKKIARRLLPFAFLLYFLSLIDRVNLSFAALTMNKDLGFTPYAYGVGRPYSSSGTSGLRFRAT